MSFASEIKNEVAQKVMEENDARAELSALVQICSVLTLSSGSFGLLIRVENAAVARRIFSLIKDRYDVDIKMTTKKKTNLKKNRIYELSVTDKAQDILKDVGLYSTRGLRDKPLQKIVKTDNNARAYLLGAFMAGGSINSPEKPNYHLELSASSLEHAQFMQKLLKRFSIPSKQTSRRNKPLVYVKSAEKIADFLRIIEANEAVLKYENIRISRDFTNSITRLNNMDVANEMKTQAAALNQIEDIKVLKKRGLYEKLDQKLMDVAELRLEYPEASLNELALTYERRTGANVSKSGMKHRFNRIHELANKARTR